MEGRGGEGKGGEGGRGEGRGGEGRNLRTSFRYHKVDDLY